MSKVANSKEVVLCKVQTLCTILLHNNLLRYETFFIRCDVRPLMTFTSVCTKCDANPLKDLKSYAQGMI
jgi:hypothetical protein